jgi:hypothetical protein
MAGTIFLYGLATMMRSTNVDQGGAVNRSAQSGPGNRTGARAQPNYDPPEPVQRIVFIKLMKVGGTTLQGILWRFAREHGLTLAVNRNPRAPSDILAHHMKLQDYIRYQNVEDPVYIAMFRQPLSHAVSMFYWKCQEVKSRVLNPALELYRTESGQQSQQPMSAGHSRLLEAFVGQDEQQLKASVSGRRFNYEYQYSWIGSSVTAALENLEEHAFVVGLMHRLDESLILFMHRFGWSPREILYVSLNHYKHPQPEDLPAGYMARLNATLQPDWHFYAGVHRLWERQLQQLGASRMAVETQAFKRLRTMLLQECGGDFAESRGTSTYRPACKHNCGEGQVLDCILARYDLCIRFLPRPSKRKESFETHSMRPGPVEPLCEHLLPDLAVLLPH